MSVELSGLPIFDRERTFKGYRGFGVCRDGARDGTEGDRAAQPVEAAPAPPAPAEPPKEPERPILTIVPAAKNVVPFPSAADKRPALSPVERSAFVEIGETLKNGAPAPATAAPVAPAPPPEPAEPRAPQAADTEPTPSAFATPAISAEAAQKSAEAQLAVLERLPVGVLIHRNDALLYANRAFLEWTGYADLAAVVGRGRAGAPRGRSAAPARSTASTAPARPSRSRRAPATRSPARAASIPCRGRARAR